MDESPYDINLITSSDYGDRRPVVGEVVALLYITFEERGLKLIQSWSRALIKDEIHELMITDEERVILGGDVDKVSAIAFFEVKNGGLLVVGDKVTLNNVFLGVVVGYDVSHMPNHINVLLKAGSLESPTLRVGDKLIFRKPF